MTAEDIIRLASETAAQVMVQQRALDDAEVRGRVLERLDDIEQHLAKHDTLLERHKEILDELRDVLTHKKAVAHSITALTDNWWTRMMATTTLMQWAKTMWPLVILVAAVLAATIRSLVTQIGGTGHTP